MDGFELEQSQSEECRTEGDDLHQRRQHKVRLFVVGLDACGQHVGFKQYDNDQCDDDLRDVERRELFAYFLHIITLQIVYGS